MSRKGYAVLFCLIFFSAFLGPGLVLAQTAEQKAEQEAKLQKELAKIEAQIAAQTKLLQSKQQETASIQRDVDILTYQINRAKLNIQAKEIEIKRLGTDIGKKQTTILTLSERIEQGQESLGELLRKTRDQDLITLPEVVLDGQRFSDFFVDVESFHTVSDALNSAFVDIRENKDRTEVEKTTLTNKRNQEIDARKIIESEKRTIESKEKEKKNLLALSKGQENSYKVVLAEQERQRAAIRSALFRLRGATNISFGEALDHANFISKKTGVRPAFILAIITQETNLGENIGTCNRPGDPPEKSWQAIMKPSRDHAPYLQITQSLGLSPESMPLSCPAPGGYGGAMGPAQFIPSTWIGMIGRITGVTGNNPPNPWMPRDAFTASALYLADLGAALGGYTNERTAALKYYAGGNWSKPQNAFYGDSVMQIAAGYQTQIDILQKN